MMTSQEVVRNVPETTQDTHGTRLRVISLNTKSASQSPSSEIVNQHFCLFVPLSARVPGVMTSQGQDLNLKKKPGKIRFLKLN